jgi:hypothetical protein
MLAWYIGLEHLYQTFKKRKTLKKLAGLWFRAVFLGSKTDAVKVRGPVIFLQATKNVSSTVLLVPIGG